MPDFDQRQDDTWRTRFSWTFCGPTALANIMWWFDSKNSDPNGYPGDGIDTYPLIENYNPPGNPIPGPYLDDHNFNNINDPTTSWDEKILTGELIELLAKYVNIHWYKIPLITLPGTDTFSLSIGAKQWIKDAGLEDKYNVEKYYRPSFQLINEKLRQNCGIILRLGYYISHFSIIFPLIFGHYVSVAGVNSNGSIAISDPEWDITNPTDDPLLHNDPSIVSHDIYQTDNNPPFPSISDFWFPNFERHRRVLVLSAIIISEV
jgi:hypothetical protein